MEDENTFVGSEKIERIAENVNERKNRNGTIIQIIACLIANTTVVGPAMALGYSAVALGPLASDDSGIEVTENELSWIASVTAIATPIGCILSSFSMRRGRRFAMITTSLISSIGWFTIYFSRNVNHILIGRAVSGISMGLSSVPTTIYVAEIAAPKLRGIVVTWTSFSIALGILIVYILGYVFQKNWRLVALTCGLFPLLSSILVLMRMPESPSWLRGKGRNLEAELTELRLSGVRITNYSNLELKSLKPESAESRAEAAPKPREKTSGVNNLKPFLILIGYFFFQQFSGIFVVIYYAVDITLEAGVRIDGNLAAILIGFTRLLSTVFVSYVSRKFGRRNPSILSGIGMTLFMCALSAYLWLNNERRLINDYGIIPVFSLIMYIVTSTMGFLVMPFAMIGEMYQSKSKDLFSGLTTCAAYVFSFFILKIYPSMLKKFDKHGVFLFYGVVSFVGTLFVHLFLPETKGKTLNEIQQLFNKKTIVDGRRDDTSNDKDADNDQQPRIDVVIRK